ncbi:hypothetical protein [Pedobacter sp. GR22-6]|uniref:hypothetical protein n=1 Tax=Pedobacter sp. GR22-6 TaxID=3127957 RepID=UPI00307E039C
MKNLFKTAIFVALFLMTMPSKAQLSICYDKDGFTNVRKSASINSKVIGKITEGQVFAIASYTQEEENKSPDWVAVNFPLAVKKYGGDLLKFSGKEQLGYIHKSRLVRLEQLPSLDLMKSDANTVTHDDGYFAVTIETGAFRPKDHQVIQQKTGTYLIDGKRAFAYYGAETHEIKRITLKSKTGKYIVPAQTFKNLFGVSAVYTTVYRGEKEEYYIVFDAGDGADAYNIVYCWKDNRLFSMTVTSTIP